MKLYTEEQVIKAYKDGNRDGFNHVCITDTYLDFVTPIELPSDEEIEKEGEWLDNPLERINWKEGAKWMKQQILNQNTFKEKIQQAIENNKIDKRN